MRYALTGRREAWREPKQFISTISGLKTVLLLFIELVMSLWLMKNAGRAVPRPPHAAIFAAHPIRPTLLVMVILRLTTVSGTSVYDSFFVISDVFRLINYFGTVEQLLGRFSSPPPRLFSTVWPVFCFLRAGLPRGPARRIFH